MANIIGARRQYIKLLGHWIADNIAVSISPKAPAQDEAVVAIYDSYIVHGEGQEGQGGVFIGDAGEVSMAVCNTLKFAPFEIDVN